MVDYRNLANKIGMSITNLTDDHTNINNILTEIEGIYTGDSADKLCKDLTNTLSSLESQISYLKKFKIYLEKIASHKDLLDTLKRYEYLQGVWTPPEDNPDATNPWDDDVDTYEDNITNIEIDIRRADFIVTKYDEDIAPVQITEKPEYKDCVAAATEEIEGVENVALNLSAYSNFLEGLPDDRKFFSNPSNFAYESEVLSKHGVTTEAYETAFAANSLGASPREKAVIAGMTLIQLERENGVTAKYMLSSDISARSQDNIHTPYTTDDVTAYGVDCGSLACFILDKSSSPSGRFNNSNVDDIVSLAGAQSLGYDYSSLKPGDFLVNDTHIAMYLDTFENERNGNTYITMLDAARHSTEGPTESENFPAGARIQYVNVTNLKNGGFEAYNFDNWYAES